GEEFVCKTPQLYGGSDRKSKNTQDAHEGIRPTGRLRRPDAVKKYLSADQFKLYQLVWQRFMASQMAPAVFDTTTVDFLIQSERDRPTEEGVGGSIGRPRLSRPR